MKNWSKTANSHQLIAISKSLLIVFLFLTAILDVPEVRGDSTKPLSVKEVLQKVEEAQAKVRDVQMDLDMEMTDSLSGQKQTFKGAVKTKSSGKIFVHYTKPEEQFLYISGNLAQMYQPGQKMVYRQKNPAGKNAPLYLGVSRELKRYAALSRVSIARNSDSEALLLFTPKSEDAGFDKMKVMIRKKDWWPCQVEVETAAGRTKARFSRLVFNQGVEEKWFKFKPPPDAQVVEGVIF